MIMIDNTPVNELRTLAAEGVPAWLCVDPVEYHGPHLSILNDQLISDGFMRQSHAALKVRHPDWPLISAGQLGIGVDGTQGPGTIDVPYREVVRQTRAACQRLTGLGFGRLIIMTFHGSPFHNAALWEVADELRARGVRVATPMNVLTRRIMSPDPEEFAPVYATVPNPAEAARLRARAHEDFHSGFGETSLALHFVPETVTNHRSVPPAPPLKTQAGWEALARGADRLGRVVLAQELRFVGLGLAWFGLRPFPGYTCEPALANAEAGAIFADLISAGIVDEVEAVLVDGAPSLPPVLRWTSTLTFGGRFGRAKVPLSACVHQVHPHAGGGLHA